MMFSDSLALRFANVRLRIFRYLHRTPEIPQTMHGVQIPPSLDIKKGNVKHKGRFDF